MKTTIKLFALMFVLFFASKAQAQRINAIPDSLMKKKIVKVEFFSPLSGNLTLGYETYLKNFISLEFKAGMIGAGIQDHSGKKEVGVFISGGPKFKLKPDYAVDGMYGTHLLSGGYIRPEITVGTFSVDREDYFSSYEYDDNATFVNLSINYGKQYVLGDIMTLDWYLGLGYGYATEDDLSYYYKGFFGTNEFPVSFSAGFTLGVLLN